LAIIYYFTSYETTALKTTPPNYSKLDLIINTSLARSNLVSSSLISLISMYLLFSNYYLGHLHLITID